MSGLKQSCCSCPSGCILDRASALLIALAVVCLHPFCTRSYPVCWTPRSSLLPAGQRAALAGLQTALRVARLLRLSGVAAQDSKEPTLEEQLQIEEMLIEEAMAKLPRDVSKLSVEQQKAYMHQVDSLIERQQTVRMQREAAKFQVM